MELLDWGIVAVILISILISIWRGAVREILSLTTWLIAAFVGFKFNSILVPFYSAFTANAMLQQVASFLTLFILVVIIGTILAVAVSKATSSIGLGGLDRILGILFGCARGVLIISLIVLLAGQTELPSQDWWKNSTLMPQFEKMAGQINDWIKAEGYEPFSANPKVPKTPDKT